MKDQKTELRILEQLGGFTIQAKVINSKTTGYLWWRKTTTTGCWQSVDTKGNGIQYLIGMGYLNPLMRTFDTLEAAKEKVDLIKRGNIIHSA